MGVKEDRKLLEAALYAAEHPLTVQELQSVLNLKSETYVKQLLDDIRASLRRKQGPFELRESGGGSYSIRLKRDVSEKLGRLVPKLRISRGALKTLALIAYKQNITLAKLAELRGSRAYEHVRQLVAAGFVEARRVGRTRALRTSPKFASYFGLEDDIDQISEKLEEMLKR
jgi:segregation and condensation protein B